LNCCLQIEYKNRIGIRELKAHSFYTSKRLIYPEVTEEEFKQGKRMDARLPEKPSTPVLHLSPISEKSSFDEDDSAELK